MTQCEAMNDAGLRCDLWASHLGWHQATAGASYLPSTAATMPTGPTGTVHRWRRVYD